MLWFQQMEQRRLKQQGMALVLSLMVATLVATLAATAFWQQWRQHDMEAADRDALQAKWIINAALDRAQAALNAGAPLSSTDLTQPWAAPKEETRLSALPELGFEGPLAERYWIAWRITDLQSFANANNLVEQDPSAQSGHEMFTRLFKRLQLPQGELETLRQRLNASMGGEDTALLRPIRLADLPRFGLSSATCARIAPFVTLIPAGTKINVNTAAGEVLYAGMAGLQPSDEQKLLQFRRTNPFASLAAVNMLLAASTESENAADANSQLLTVGSRYFLITVTLRQDRRLWVEESIVVHNRRGTRVVFRAPSQAGTDAPCPKR